MLNIKFNLIKQEVWFAKEVNFFNIFRLLEYKQIGRKHLFFNIEKFDTLVINLELTIEEIKKKFKSNYKNEVNKAEKLGMCFLEEGNFNRFKLFYNTFAKEKSLQLLSNRFDSYIPYCQITKIIYDDKILVMHLYIVDQETKRVRLLYSSTNVSVSDRKIIGIANKFLHFKDIIFFKNRDFSIYDLGGVNLSSSDKHIQGINNFKKGFGGTLYSEYNLTSYPLYFLRKIL